MSYQPLSNEEKSSSDVTPPYSPEHHFHEHAHPLYEPSIRRKHGKHHKHSMTKAVVGTAVGSLALFGVFSMGRMYENYSFHNAMLMVNEQGSMSGNHHGDFRPMHHRPHGDDKWWMKFHEGESPEVAEAKHNEWLAAHPHHAKGKGKGHKDDKWWMKFHKGESPEEAERKHKEWLANHPEEAKAHAESNEDGEKDDKWWMKFHKGESPEEALRKHKEWLAKHPHGADYKGKGHKENKEGKQGQEWWMKFHKGESPEEALKKHNEWLAKHPEEAKAHGEKPHGKPEEKPAETEENQAQESAKALI